MTTPTKKEHIAPVDTAVISTLESIAARRTRWANLLRRQHYQPVIEEVLDEELPKYQISKIIDPSDRVTLLRECALILASAPSVFAAAVEGNLVSQMLKDTGLQREYAEVQERAHVQPSIYIHLLADERGIVPSPSQYLIIRDLVADYIASKQESDHAWSIDNITLPIVTKHASNQGYRTLMTFCDGIQTRCASTDLSLHNLPLRVPPGECGYSQNSHLRLAQHRAHRSSNYIMNLVEDICTYLYNTNRFTQHFQMHQFIIYLIFRPIQAAIAEIFCSGLLQVWVENGGGFNAYPAGRSVATAKKVSEDAWEEHERWAMERSDLMENMRVQRNRAEEWSRALEWEKGNKDVEMGESL